MNILEQILAFVQSVPGKAILLYVFGWLLKLNPNFPNSAIPIATLVTNIVVALLATLAEAGGIKPAVYAVAAVAQGNNLLLDIILPQLIADGAYNWPRKVWAWISGLGKK